MKEEDEERDSKETRLTLMEEVLLLGLKVGRMNRGGLFLKIILF